MEEDLRKSLARDLRKKRLISLVLLLLSPFVIYSSRASVGALFLLVLIASVFALYRFHRDLRTVTLGKFLEYKFLGYTTSGTILPRLQDPEDGSEVIGEFSGEPKEDLKVFGFKHRNRHYFVK